MRNRLHQKNQPRTSHGIEDLRKKCFEGTTELKQFKVEELSPLQDRDHTTVNLLLGQSIYRIR